MAFDTKNKYKNMYHLLTTSYLRKWLSQTKAHFDCIPNSPWNEYG